MSSEGDDKHFAKNMPHYITRKRIFELLEWTKNITKKKRICHARYLRPPKYLKSSQNSPFLKAIALCDSPVSFLILRQNCHVFEKRLPAIFKNLLCRERGAIVFVL